MVAALFVILIHVSCQGFYSFSDFWKVCVKFDSAARMAVPLFFLLSGYFLFSDKPPMLLASFLKRRFSRILIPLILTFVIYLVVRHWTFSDWIHRIFTGQISFHLWFMYALVGLYLAVPLFQPLFTTEAGRKIALYYVVLWLCCAVFYAYAKRYFGLSFNPFGQFNFHYFFGFMGFFFTGGLLRRVRVTLCWRWFWALVCVLATVLIYRFTKSWSLSLGSPNELFFENLSPFVVLQAVSFFSGLKRYQVGKCAFDVRCRAYVLDLSRAHVGDGGPAKIHRALCQCAHGASHRSYYGRHFRLGFYRVHSALPF